MSTDCIDWAVEDGIATLTITREKALNALNREVMDALSERIDEVAHSAEISGLIITGSGPKAFVAGADIGELRELSGVHAGKASITRGQSILNRLEALRRPVIACVNGFALGGGLELALACHMRYGLKAAQLGLPEVKLGVIPGYGGTQRLARIVGRGLATELILTGHFCDGEEAHRIGLLNRLFESAEEMLEAARKTLKAIGSRGPLAIQAALEAIDRGLSLSLAEGLRVEGDLFAQLCQTEDMKEGLSAFLEKRPPAFKGL